MRKLFDKYIVIEWVDSAGLSGVWHDDEVVQDLSLDPIKSIGRVVHEDEDFITLASHLATNQLSGVVCIPRVVIKKTKILFHYKDIFKK